MPTPTKGHRLGGSPAHERHILANLATALFQHGRITTTEAKARRLRPVAERLITFAKRGDLHARRQVMTVIRDKDVVHKLFAEIGPKFAARPGGYTRIIKVNPRKGDNAPMAVIELVTDGVEARPQRRRARRPQPAGGRAGRAAQTAPAEAEIAETDTVGAEEITDATAGEPEAEAAEASAVDAEPDEAELDDSEADDAGEGDDAEPAAEAGSGQDDEK